MLDFEADIMAGSATPRRNPGVPRLPSAFYKPSPAKQLTQIFKELRQLMNAEWSNIRSMNLGVRSGTAAVTDALYRQLQQLVLQLHALVIQHEEAAAVLVQLAGTLSLMEGQQLQILLDTTGHEELSDYLKLLLKDAWSQPDWLPASALRRGGQDAAAGTSGSTTSSSKGGRKGSSTTGSGSWASNRATGSLRATGGSSYSSGRLGSSSLRSSREGTGATTSGDMDGDIGSTSPGRRRGCGMPPAMIAEIARQRLLAEDDEVELPPSILNKGDKSLRFRRCCHPHAPLVMTAERLQQELTFQQEVAEAEAAAAAGAAGVGGLHGSSRQHSARLFGRSYGGDPNAFAASMRRPGTGNKAPLQQLLDLAPALSWGSTDWPESLFSSRPTSSQLAAARAASADARREAARYEPLMVPCKDVETVWAEGRAAAGLTALAMTHAEQLLLGGMDCIVLADGISFQPRFQQPAQTEGQGTTAPSSSRSSIRSAAMAALAANKSSSSIQGSSGAAQDSSMAQGDGGDTSDTPGKAAAAAAAAAAVGAGFAGRAPRRSTVAWREAAGAASTATPTAGDKQASLPRPAAGHLGLGAATGGRGAVAGGGTGVVPELPLSHLGRPSSASSSTTGLATPPMSARSAGGQPTATNSSL